MAAEISDEHLEKVCRLGAGKATCAYLLMNPAVGMVCAKGSPVELTIRARLAEGSMNATGDNCPGWAG